MQLHYAEADPFRDDAWVEATLADIRRSGARVEFHEYAASGHLFTDESLPDEYDPEACELLWKHVDDFLDSLGG